MLDLEDLYSRTKAYLEFSLATIAATATRPYKPKAHRKLQDYRPMTLLTGPKQMKRQMKSKLRMAEIVLENQRRGKTKETDHFLHQAFNPKTPFFRLVMLPARFPLNQLSSLE